MRSIVRIPLTQGQTAVIDAADWPKVRRVKWCAFHDSTTGWYAIGRDRIAGRNVRLHRFIMDAQPGEVIDHADGDGLNCRRSNLRRASSSQNSRNMKRHCDNLSGFKGVRRNTNGQKWSAGIWDGRQHRQIGSFDTAQAAARAYDAEARRIFGEFARCNYA